MVSRSGRLTSGGGTEWFKTTLAHATPTLNVGVQDDARRVLNARIWLYQTKWKRASQLSAPGLVRQLVGTRCKNGWLIATVGRGINNGPIWQLIRSHERELIAATGGINPNYKLVNLAITLRCKAICARILGVGDGWLCLGGVWWVAIR